MTNTTEIYAPAKINLFLEVKDKRPNGYHDIDTVMAAVSLCDKLNITVKKSGGDKNSVRMSGDNPALPYGEGNLCVRAAKAFLQSAGITGADVEIKLQKKIPLSAGLAGGSSDAAAVLRALNLLFAKQTQKNQKSNVINPVGEKIPTAGDLKNVPGLFTNDKLSEIAARIGADIPFCLNGGIAHAGGIGELLTPCETAFNDGGIDLVISIPDGFSVSTPYAYSLIDKRRENEPYKKELKDSENIRGICMLKTKELTNVKEALFNRFEDVIIPLCPKISEIKRLMLENGAFAALMSGSGPSVFGLFESEKQAELSAALLQKSGYSAYVCRMLL